jgi:hypothetical protein
MTDIMTEMREICSLDDDAFAARRKELRGGLMQRVRTRDTLPDGHVLLFDATPQNRQSLEEFVAFEQQCCASLAFSLRDTSAGLQLEIRGVPGTSAGFTGPAATQDPQMNAAVGGDRDRESPARLQWRRFARAGGLGGLLSVAVCCGLPIGVALIAGVGVAAPLGFLENPWIIGGSGVGFTTLLVLWERHSKSTRTAGAASPECGC